MSLASLRMLLATLLNTHFETSHIFPSFSSLLPLSLPLSRPHTFYPVSYKSIHLLLNCLNIAYFVVRTPTEKHFSILVFKKRAALESINKNRSLNERCIERKMVLRACEAIFIESMIVSVEKYFTSSNTFHGLLFISSRINLGLFFEYMRECIS